MIGRMRGFRPPYFQDGDIYDLEAASRLPIRVAFLALWNWTDREGRFEWNPRILKLNLLPYDPVDMAAVLDVMHKGNLIQPYEVGGRKYGVVNPYWWEQQNINKNEAQSELPKPTEKTMKLFEQGVLAQAFHSYRDDSTVTSSHGIESAPRDSKIPAYADTLEVKGSEGNRNELNGSEELPTPGSGDAVSSTVQQAILSPISSTENGQIVSYAANGDRGSGSQRAPLPAIVGRRTQQAIVERLGAVIAEIESGARERLKRQDTRVLQSELVFSYWQAKTGHDKAIMDMDRERRIVRRLEENGGDVSELLYAIDGCLKDRHLQGENDRNRKYDGIETIFRDRAIIERLAGSMKGYRNKEMHPMVAKYAAAVGAQE